MLCCVTAATVTLGGVIIALGASLAQWGHEPTMLFGRMVVFDAFAVFFKILLNLALVAAVLMSLTSREVAGQPNEGEYYTLLVSSGLGMLLMASAANLLMAYLALEFVSLTSYVLTGFLRHNRRSGEAALKYLIYGGVASGTMIYGMSWIFGMTGSLDYSAMQAALAQNGISKAALFMAFVFIMAGFGYKIVFVPFHMWSPDVYQGAPTPFTAFLSVASNAAGMAIMIRFFFPGVSRMVTGGDWTFVSGVEWPHVLLFLSMITMTVGNLCALNQRNLKRMLAYSGIAHAGYMLMGLAVLNNDGLSAILFTLGVAGVLLRRNTIIIFMSVELMLNAVNLSFVALARQWGSMDGQLIVFFVMAVAAAEAAVGLAIILMVFRNRETVNADELNLMRW